MKKFKYIYLISTILVSASMLMGAYFEFSGSKEAQEILTHIGYPLYFNYILSLAKLLGVIFLWQRIFPTLKEWAYAGFVFDLVGAVISHHAVGDDFSESMPALINLLFVLLSYIAYRKLEAEKSGIVRIKA